MQLDSHRKQLIWQVYLPFVLVCLFLTALALFLFGEITTGEADYRIWSDISMVVLAIPVILAYLLIFVLITLIIFLISRINNKLKIFFNKINPFSKTIAHWVQSVSNGITQPVIFIESLMHHQASDKMNQNQE